MKRVWSAAFLLAAAGPAAADLDFSGDVGLEVEVFHERYRSGDVFEYLSDPSAYEEQYASSTLETDAQRTSGVLALRLNASGAPGSIDVRNEYAHGPELLRDELSLDASYRLAPRRTLRITDRVDLRRDLDGSLSYDTDLQHAAAAEFRADSLGGGWSVRFRDEISNARVDGDSLGRVFDSDRNRATLLLERGGGVDWGLEGALVHKETPGGVTGAYRETGLRMFARRTGASLFWDAEVTSRRRGYHDESLSGAGGWFHEIRASVGREVGRWGIDLTDEVSVARYDEPDEVFTDYFQNRFAVRGRLSVSDRLTAELEPALETLRAEASQKYDELSMEAGLSLDVLSDGWIRVSQQVGRRNYGGGADSTLSVSFGGLDLSLESSDYLFANSSVMGQAGVGAGVAVEVFLDFTLERHDRDEEGFSLFSFTTSVTRRF